MNNKMARKKNEPENKISKKELSFAERQKRLDAITDAVNADAGQIVCGRIDDPEIVDKLTIRFIPSPNDDLNEAIGGGFPIGRTTIITGKEDSGKTGILLETIALNMKKDPDFIALWLESEQSLNLDYMINQFGIDPSRFYFVQMTLKDGAEVALDRCEAYLRVGGINMFCINSMRALIPKTELNKPISEDTVAMQARMNTKVLKKYLSICYENNIACVIVQHLTTLIGTMSRDPFAMGGGMFMKYGGLLIMDMRKQSIIDTDPITKEEGMKILISIKKNHVTPKLYPYVKVLHYVIYGEGTEVILTTLNKALEQGLLEQKGAWISWPEKNLKWCGKINFRAAMKEDVGLFTTLRNLVSGNVEKLTEEEMLELEINIENDIIKAEEDD